MRLIRCAECGDVEFEWELYLGEYPELVCQGCGLCHEDSECLVQSWVKE